jgi:hypothetical protein
MNSKQYQKVNKDVLIEWLYDDNNTISEPYKILSNQRDLTRQYLASDTTITKNNLSNQFFKVDVYGDRYAKVDTEKYPFLTTEELVDQEPIIHDRVTIYLPSNWSFGEYQGVHLRLYTYDSTNKQICELSSFYFDVNDTSTSTFLTTDIVPALEYQERLWNKTIEFQIPSVYHVSRVAVDPTYFLDTSVNFRLTNGRGLSQDAPIFLEFRFINKIVTILDEKRYVLSNPVSVQFPQRPEMEGIKLFLAESSRGDYFEMYGTLGGTFDEFVDYLNTSKQLGKYYKLEFSVTLYEDNRAGRTLNYVIEDNFNEIVEYRPILRYSSSSASIDVEMRIVDTDSGQINTKKAVYGLKTDQLSKYSINFKRINVRNALKPKIYQRIKTSDYAYDQIGRINPENTLMVPVPVLRNINQSPSRVVANSNAALNVVATDRMSNFHPIGNMKIAIKPFDNVVNFTIYTKSGRRFEPLNLSDCRELRLIFKSDSDTLEFTKYSTPTNSNAHMGMCGFRILESEVTSIRNLYNNGGRLFYITCTNQGVRMMIYSGLFTIRDPSINPLSDAGDGQVLIPESSQVSGGVALVSRKVKTPIQKSPVPKKTNQSFTEKRVDAQQKVERKSRNT